MLYTIGHKASYDEYLATDKTPMKMGKRGALRGGAPYLGGAVFLTKAEAEAFIKNTPRHNDDFAVYGLATTAENTWQVPDEPYRRLIHDARIVKAE